MCTFSAENIQCTVFEGRKKNLQTDVYDINFVLQKEWASCKMAEAVSLR